MRIGVKYRFTWGCGAGGGWPIFGREADGMRPTVPSATAPPPHERAHHVQTQGKAQTCAPCTLIPSALGLTERHEGQAPISCPVSVRWGWCRWS